MTKNIASITLGAKLLYGCQATTNMDKCRGDQSFKKPLSNNSAL
jgi:hypothetical protein